MVPTLAQGQLAVLADVLLAMLLGGAIGFERALSGKAAGMRTHMLIAGAACFLVLLGTLLTSAFANGDTGQLRSDPLRMIEAVVAAIGFIGGGMIIRQSRAGVEGLTTAASLLFTAGVGICVALSQFALAIGATLLVVVVLAGFSRVESWLARRLRGNRND
ncbi:MAG: MgtC/SapB family protein [Acidobacteria bacterium]|nr:MgtC/SapB family protein [Acidobacteriota bacterium]